MENKIQTRSKQPSTRNAFVKASNQNSPGLTFNKSSLPSFSSQKYLDPWLNERLDFCEYVESKMNKCNNTVGAFKKLSFQLTHDPLLRICLYKLCSFSLYSCCTQK